MKLLHTIRERHRSFHHNEGGQVLLLVAIFALSLLAVSLSIIPVGQAITGRMQLQNAADSAALTATTWMARGANIQQILNGVHFDFDTYTEFIIGVTCDKWIAKLAEDTSLCADISPPHPAACIRIIPMVGGDWTGARRDVRNYISKQQSVASQFKAMQETIADGIPMLAFIEASEVAKANGAGKLDAIGDAELFRKIGIGPLVKEALKVVEQVGGMLGIPVTTTTLNPSINPLSALQFSSPMTPAKHGYCGRMSCSYNAHWMDTCTHCISPPIVMPVWTSGFSWQDTYYLSTNVNTAITFIVAREPRPSYILNSLFLRNEDLKAGITNVIPAAFAIASAEIYNDQLYPAGMSGMTYQPLFATVFSSPLPYSRFLGVLTSIYGGKFKARLRTVEIEGMQPVTQYLIYH